MIFDGKEDESFFVFDEERFFFLIEFGMFLFLFGGFFDDVFFSGDDGSGVFFSSSCAGEFLFESGDGEVSFCADVHF
jgi:hypothetical protein